MTNKLLDLLRGLPGDVAQAVVYPLETLRGEPWAVVRAVALLVAVGALLVWLL